MAVLNMDQLIDRLSFMLGRQFSEDISNIYYGDVGLYPPQAFKSYTGEERCVVAIVPSYITEPEDRTAGSESYRLGVHVLVLVNMIPYFQFMPQEAYGERMLVRTTIKIREFLAQDANFNLDGDVDSTKVGRVDWDWLKREDQALRGAAIEYEALTEVSRQQL